MLTTITTVFGLLPITISDEFWRGLGFSVIFGLTTATFLTLMIIPILFTIFLRDKKSSEIVEENENLNTSDEYISPRQIA
jgi:Cu/Ag efflux pump CusA